MIPSRLQSESGYTVAELLIAMSLMLIILGATLTTLDLFAAHAARNAKTQDQQEIVRRGVDRMVKQLRNLANPTNGTGQTIGYADDNRLVFQTTDPQRQWVEYCLDSSTASNGKLWYRISTGSTSPTNLGTDTCPPTNANGWTATGTQISDRITNNNGTTRPLFSYETRTGPLTAGSAVATANLSKIVRIGTQIYLDLDTTKPPPEIGLTSGVYLRNQNQFPTSQFTGAFAAAKTWVFNGTASTDPEGTNMQYAWYRETGQPTAVPSSSTTPTLTNLPDCTTSPPATFTLGGKTWTCMGTGIILSYDFGAVQGLASPTNVWLRTTDAGKLQAFSAAGSTNCPTATQTSPARTDNQCQQIPF